MAKNVSAECSECGLVAAERIGSYERTYDDDGIPITEEHILAKCPACHAPLLLRQDGPEFSPDGSYPDAVRLFPARRQADVEIPRDVRKAFDEAIACREAKRFRAAAVMCRGALECVCQHLLKQPGWKLAANLKALHGAGFIDDRLLDWAKSLHLEGNRAAHDFSANVSREDADDMLTFTEAILSYVFVIKERFEAYKNRVSKRAQGKKASK